MYPDYEEAIYINDLNADYPNQDFVGIKRADVDGSCSACTGGDGQMNGEGVLAMLKISDLSMEAGEILRLPVFLESSMPIGACAFALGFDPAYVDVLAVEPSGFIPGWDEETLNHRALADGVVRVAWTNPGGSGIQLDQNQPFLYVVLQARKGVTSLSHFARLMPQLQDCSVVSPDLQVNHIELGFEESFIDFWVHPNPANDYVMIHYELGQNVPLEVEIFDSSGRLVWNKEWANYAPDVQNWVIQVSTWPEGVYVARIQRPGGSISSRFVIAR